MPNSLSRSVLAVAVTAAGLLAQPAAVRAQSYGYYGGPRSDMAQWHIDAGFSDITGASSSYLEGGWLVDGGFSYFPQAGALGVRADLSYSAYAANRDYLGYGPGPGPGGGFGRGYGDFSSGSIGGVVRVPWTGRSHFYALGQIGFSYVQLHSDQYFYGPGGSCNPYYGYCGYGYGNNYDTTHLSWNVGVGVEFPLYWGQNWFLEAQYRQIQTPTPIEYWPITVGLRF